MQPHSLLATRTTSTDSHHLSRLPVAYVQFPPCSNFNCCTENSDIAKGGPGLACSWLIYMTFQLTVLSPQTHRRVQLSIATACSNHLCIGALHNKPQNLVTFLMNKEKRRKQQGNCHYGFPHVKSTNANSPPMQDKLKRQRFIFS